MKILIVGSTSIIGNAFKFKLGHEYDIKTAGRNGPFDYYMDLHEFSLKKYFPDDIGKVDLILHCAASFSNDLLENESINSLGSLYVALLAQHIQCQKVIYLSSTSTFNVEENENFSSYGLSKKHGEENMAWVCKNNDISFTSIAISQVYDDFGFARKHQPFLYNLIDSARKGEDFFIWGSKDPYRNYLHLNDLIESIRKIIESGISGYYPCTYPQSYKISQIASMVYDVFDNGGNIRFLFEKPAIPSVYIPDSRILYEKIGFSPIIDLKEGVERIKCRMK